MLSELRHDGYAKKLQIPGTSSTIEPGNYNCDSYNIVYLLMCNKCDCGNYIGETSNKQTRLNNHKKASETTAGLSRWLFISTNPTIYLQI